MGKKKLAVIDDSVVEEVKVKKPPKDQNKGANTNGVILGSIATPEPAETEAVISSSSSSLSDLGVDDLSGLRAEGLNKSEALPAGPLRRSFSEASRQGSQDESSKSADSSPAKPDQNDEQKASDSPTKKAKKSSKQQKKARQHRSAKYLESRKKVERMKLYPISEATELAKQASYSKYDGTLEIHINTATKGIRGLINLPFASGKKLTILAFGKWAEESGADLIGDDAALKEIEKGKIGFDVLVTTAEWMPKLARAAKVLGPKGLMPNPKSGTISTDLKKTVAELQGGKTEYKSESKANVIHLGIGKISQPSEELSQNLKLLLSTIGKTKIKKAVISPTLGPAIRIDLNSI